MKKAKGTAKKKGTATKKAVAKKKKRATETIPSPVLVGGRQLATLFAVAARTVRHWHTEMGMPKAGPDRYDLRAVIQWRIQLERSDALGEKHPDAVRYKKALAEEKEEKAASARMRRRRLEGELIDRGKIESERIERIQAVKTALGHLAAILARRLAPAGGARPPGREIREIVNEEVEKMLGSFARATEVEQVTRKNEK